MVAGKFRTDHREDCAKGIPWHDGALVSQRVRLGQDKDWQLKRETPRQTVKQSGVGYLTVWQVRR
jgi:hypothetical protein